MLLLADVAGLVTAFVVAGLLTRLGPGPDHVARGMEYFLFFASLPLWIVVAKIYGLYERDEERTDHSTTDDFAGVFHMVTVCAFIFWALSYGTKIAHPSPPKLFIFWAAAVGFVSTGRACARAIARKNVAYLQNTVIVGAGD